MFRGAASLAGYAFATVARGRGGCALKTVATRSVDSLEQPAKVTFARRSHVRCVTLVRVTLTLSLGVPQIRLVAPKGVFVAQELDMRSIKWIGWVPNSSTVAA